SGQVADVAPRAPLARRAGRRHQPDADRADGGHDPRAQRAREDVPDRRAQHAVRARAVRPRARARGRQLHLPGRAGPHPARPEGARRLPGRGLRPRRGGMLRPRGVIAGCGGADVLQGVDLEVREGSIACIVGPNGAGKSTVLRAVSALVRPREGAITLEGERLNGCSTAEVLERGIVQVPQSGALFPNISVRENVLMGAYILRRDTARLTRRYAEIEELFPVVAERAGDKAGNLSGGQRRMVEFARSLMLEARLVMVQPPP